MRSHPQATDDHHDNMKKTEAMLASRTNHAGIEKIPQDLLDQEKVAKMYSYLRRESMATGECNCVICVNLRT